MRLLRPSLPALLALATALCPALAACGDTSSSSTGAAPDATPSRTTMQVVLLDDQPDPFATLPPPVPKGIALFQEDVVVPPGNYDTRAFVRLVIQPGETLPQAMARAKPWFDARPLPPGDRLVFSQIREEDEITKKRVAVGVRTYVATSQVILTQDDVAEATIGAAPDDQNKPQPVAMITLTPDAGERFRKFTKENSLRRIAVLIHDNVVMAPLIQGEITGGKLSISMGPELPYEVKRAELQELVDKIKPKAAPATSAR